MGGSLRRKSRSPVQQSSPSPVGGWEAGVGRGCHCKWCSRDVDVDVDGDGDEDGVGRGGCCCSSAACLISRWASALPSVSSSLVSSCVVPVACMRACACACPCADADAVTVAVATEATAEEEQADRALGDGSTGSATERQDPWQDLAAAQRETEALKATCWHLAHLCNVGSRFLLRQFAQSGCCCSEERSRRCP